MVEANKPNSEKDQHERRQGPSTSASLIQKLRQPEEERKAWERFVELYTPLLLSWGRKKGLSHHDAGDLAQEVFAGLVKALPKFSYDPERGKFRSWLYTFFHRRLVDRLRAQDAAIGQANDADLASLADPAAAESFTEEEHFHYLCRRVLELMQAEFEPNTWKAGWEFLVQQLPARAVAERLGISENAVYIAVSRCRTRVREELSELFLQ